MNKYNLWDLFNIFSCSTVKSGNKGAIDLNRNLKKMDREEAENVMEYFNRITLQYLKLFNQL